MKLIEGFIAPWGPEPVSRMHREQRRELERRLRRRVSEPADSAYLVGEADTAVTLAFRQRSTARTLPSRREAEGQLRRLRLAGQAMLGSPTRLGGPEADPLVEALSDPRSPWLIARVDAALRAVPPVMSTWRELLEIFVIELTHLEGQVRDPQLRDWWRCGWFEVEADVSGQPVGPVTFTPANPSPRNAPDLGYFAELAGELETRNLRAREVHEIIATLAHVTSEAVRQWVRRRAL